MALPNFTLSEGGSLAITPAGGSVINVLDPRTISGLEFMRDKVQWKSIAQTRKRNSTGSLEHGDVTITAVYYKAEWDSLKSAFDNNKVLSAVITKPNDIGAADGTRTLTLASQMSKISFPELNSESKELEYSFTLVVDTATVA